MKYLKKMLIFLINLKILLILQTSLNEKLANLVNSNERDDPGNKLSFRDFCEGKEFCIILTFFSFGYKLKKLKKLFN